MALNSIVAIIESSLEFCDEPPVADDRPACAKFADLHLPQSRVGMDEATIASRNQQVELDRPDPREKNVAGCEAAGRRSKAALLGDFRKSRYMTGTKAIGIW
jgi:rhodanese-related sulfurtransferase